MLHLIRAHVKNRIGMDGIIVDIDPDLDSVEPFIVAYPATGEVHHETLKSITVKDYAVTILHGKDITKMLPEIARSPNVNHT